MTATWNGQQVWSDDEVVTDTKLNAMSENDQYLYEHQPKLHYQAFGDTKTMGLKIFSTVVRLEPQPNEDNVLAQPYHFPAGVWAADCRPVITLTLATADRQRSFLGFRGLDGGRIPDSRGIIITLYYEPHPVKGALPFNQYQHVHRTAIGWGP